MYYWYLLLLLSYYCIIVRSIVVFATGVLVSLTLIGFREYSWFVLVTIFVVVVLTIFGFKTFLKNKYTMPRSLSQPRVIISREIKDTANLEPLYFL
jgi:uncharacterized protein YacL